MKPIHEFIIVGGTLLVGGYITFHGHRLGKDCWMCNYRGLSWILVVALIIGADYLEKQEKEQEKYYPAWSRGETMWENDSEVGSDVSEDTVRGNK